MAKRLTTACGAMFLLAGLAGCINLKAPERIEVNAGSNRPAPVDSSRVPPTASHEQARQELVKAYQQIQYLERENDRLSRKAAEYKRERDDCREQKKRSD